MTSPSATTPSPIQIQHISSTLEQANLNAQATAALKHLSPAYAIDVTTPIFRAVSVGNDSSYIVTYPVTGPNLTTDSHFSAVLDHTFALVSWLVVVIEKLKTGDEFATVVKNGQTVLQKTYHPDQHPALMTAQATGVWGRFLNCLANLGVGGTVLSLIVDLCEPVCIVAIISLGIACVDCAAVAAGAPIAEMLYCAGKAVL